jgi:xanthine/CO dehydrogenase XdhC/CoxF family maturation factor
VWSGRPVVATYVRIDMRDVLPDIVRWQRNGERVALATVVKAIGSSPRRAGAKMAISESGAMTGSVSGGCVEADVVLHALEVLESGKPRLIEYGISDEQAFNVGLACGGMIDVYIEPLEAPAAEPNGRG